MNTGLGLDYFSPTQPFGLLILIIGIFFTGCIFYILLNLDKDSLSDKKRKSMIESERQERLRRLYPKS